MQYHQHKQTPRQVLVSNQLGMKNCDGRNFPDSQVYHLYKLQREEVKVHHLELHHVLLGLLNLSIL